MSHYLSIFLIAFLFTLPVAQAATKVKDIAANTAPVPVPEVILENARGQKMTLAQFKGKPVILHFWATWCAPCVEELPFVAAMSKEYAPKGLIVLPVSLDFQGASVVEAFYKNHNIESLPIYLDPKSTLFSTFKLPGLPASLFIDAEGKEVARVSGSLDWKSGDVKKYLDTLVAK